MRVRHEPSSTRPRRLSRVSTAASTFQSDLALPLGGGHYRGREKEAKTSTATAAKWLSESEEEEEEEEWMVLSVYTTNLDHELEGGEEEVEGKPTPPPMK